MINLVLSERDFDYELQALICSFFPGKRVCILIREFTASGFQDSLSDILLSGDSDLGIGAFFGEDRISISVAFLCADGDDVLMQKEVAVTGGDWHKQKDKLPHPYRAYYKNECKRLMFEMLRDLPEGGLPGGAERRIPVWGTMTGVRPVKIPMNELLQGKSREEVEKILEEQYCCAGEQRKLCLDIAVREEKLLRGIDARKEYSLYIGVPFCPTTCLYCSFPSYSLEKFGHLAGEYLKALKKEISAVADQCRDYRLTSIYVGGGTPTALTAEQLDEMLMCVCDTFATGESREFTVEAGRPDSITQEKLAVLRRYGVGRISINPQTMQQRTLDLIGRRHTVEDIRRVFIQARETGFSNINMDLIIGLPGETAEDLADTLRQVRELDPDSVTVHSLVVKRASRLRAALEEGGDILQQERLRGDRLEQMLRLAREFACQGGYLPYYMYRQKNSAGFYGSSGQENIGFAREGCECLYNILIMEEVQTIVAVGAGASTKRYNTEKGVVSRIENVKSVTDYIARIDEMIARKEGIFVGAGAD